MKKFPRSDRQIARAKKAQAERLGQSGAFGKRKRCRKGKSCGASCIASRKVCMVDLPWVGANSLGKVREVIQKLNKTKPDTPAEGGQKGPTIMPVFPIPKTPNPEPSGTPPFKFRELR